MSTYVMLTKVTAHGVDDSKKIMALNETLKAMLRKEALQVKWLGDYAVSGPL